MGKAKVVAIGPRRVPYGETIVVGQIAGSAHGIAMPFSECAGSKAWLYAHAVGSKLPVLVSTMARQPMASVVGADVARRGRGAGADVDIDDVNIGVPASGAGVKVVGGM